MSGKSTAGLVSYCRAQLGRPYWWGTFGQTATEALYAAKQAQYPDCYRAGDYPAQYGSRVHDCVGLIKGYLWSDGPDSPPAYDPAGDVSVSGLYAACERRGDISTLPELPGLCLFMAGLGHVGVYIGGGQVIEARGHAWGVVQTALKGRGWAYWGLPRMIAATADMTSGSSGQSGAGQSSAGQSGAGQSSAGQSCTVNLPLLRQGAVCAHVRSAQLLLIAAGFDCGADGADGDFGPNTLAALERFQRRRALEADGEIGPLTWAALLEGTA